MKSNRFSLAFFFILLAAYSGLSLVGQGVPGAAGGSNNSRPHSWTNSNGPWVPMAPPCSCSVDVKEITAPGTSTHALLNNASGEAVAWGSDGNGNPIAGVELGYFVPDIGLFSLGPFKIPYPKLAKVHIGDIQDYLETWGSGDCPVTQSGCPMEAPCWFELSYKIDAMAGLNPDPVEFIVTDASGSTTLTLHRLKPEKRVVQIQLRLEPPCTGLVSRSASVKQDMGLTTPTRSFQEIEMAARNAFEVSHKSFTLQSS